MTTGVETPVGNLGQNAAEGGTRMSTWLVDLGDNVGVILKAAGGAVKTVIMLPVEAAEFIGRFRNAGGKALGEDSGDDPA